MDQRKGLSDLPDDLKINTISRLDMRLAARTSILAKEWKSLWDVIPRMSFDHSTFGSRFDETTVFMDFVNSQLSKRTVHPTTVEIMLNDCSPAVRERVRKFLELVQEHRVQNLTMRLGNIYNINEAQLFSNVHLKELCLSCGYNDREYVINWVNLTKLVFDSMNFHSDIGNILRGCPSLGSLTLSRCRTHGFNGVDCRETIFPIISKSIQGLTIYDWDCDHKYSRVEIKELPNLQRLKVSGYSSVIKISCELLKIHSVDFDFKSIPTVIPDFKRGKIYHQLLPVYPMHFVSLFSELSCLNHLSLGPQMVEGFLHYWNEDNFRFSNIQSLTIESHIDRAEVGGIITLLRCCPRLQYLQVKRKVTEKRSVDRNRARKAEEFWLRRESIPFASLPLLSHTEVSGHNKRRHIEDSESKVLDQETAFLKNFVVNSTKIVEQELKD